MLYQLFCFCQDQLIVFMALAKGTSRLRCNSPLTLHTHTAIYIAELMTEVNSLLLPIFFNSHIKRINVSIAVFR